MNEIYKTALSWVMKGFSVIPIQYREKKPDSRLLPKDQNGDPKWETFKTQQPSEQQLKIWFASRLHNLALVMGWNNLVVIDFDIWDVFEYWYKLFPLDTYMVKTRRGMHVYLQVKNPVSNCHNDWLDVKANGYVLIPPSIHPSGFVYQTFFNQPILKVADLQEVLPKEFTPEPVKVEAGPAFIAELPHPSDPWDSAEQATVLDQDVIQKIRVAISLLTFLPGAHSTSGDGRWYMSLCPFHTDHSPSFWIDTQRGLCGCRKCNIKDMDVCDLYARLNNISNRQAIFELARML